jgi:hypothetical protein
MQYCFHFFPLKERIAKKYLALNLANDGKTQNLLPAISSPLGWTIVDWID